MSIQVPIDFEYVQFLQEKINRLEAQLNDLKYKKGHFEGDYCTDFSPREMPMDEICSTFYLPLSLACKGEAIRDDKGTHIILQSLKFPHLNFGYYLAAEYSRKTEEEIHKLILCHISRRIAAHLANIESKEN